MIFRESGIEDGKVKEFTPIEAKAKNVGRANETTPEEQALLEAFSKWKKKKDQQYKERHELSIEIEDTNELRSSPLDLRPMLAQKFDERKKYIKYPCGGSRKMDGIRAIVQLFGNNDIFISSRLGKEFNFFDKIRDQVKNTLIELGDTSLILDGELYNHSLPFSAISGAVRKKKDKSKYDDYIEYWIFDLILEDVPYKDRMKILSDFEGIYNTLYPQEERRLRFEYYELINKESEIRNFHNKYVAEGFEGLILRNLSGLYRLKHRVNDLQKYKDFEDDEFEVIDVEEGKGSEEGAAIFVCKRGNEIFHVRPRGSIEKRRWQFTHKNLYIGKMLTVRYQKMAIDVGELPRFCRGIKFSDCVEKMEPIDFRDYE
jgi:DNA ligase-1